MTNPVEFVMLQCDNPECRFRCPSNLSVQTLETCPMCGSTINPVTAPFSNTKQHPSASAPANFPIHVLLDNLRSTLNVGSIFRTADGAGVSKIHLCGTTPTPDHPKIAKTGLGAEWNLPWEFHRNGLDFVNECKANGFKVISLEAADNSRSIFSLNWSHNELLKPVLVVLGNEVSGIDPQILSASDHVCSIPMYGIKSSLNVAVAFGIAVYTIQELRSPSLR